MKFDLVILIPCYNEYSRLKTEAFTNFAAINPNCALMFCNDGSTDQTLQKLEDIKAKSSGNIFIFDSKENFGKAEIIRKGVHYCYHIDTDFEKIAYLDADLSTSLEECHEISKLVYDEVLLAFGSRVSKIDNHIDRKLYRHILGRIIATFISNALGIAVYDTQCGCKIFNGNLAKKVFNEPFISKWLFDVELFFRMIKIHGKQQLKNICREVPLYEWVDVDGSKVSFSYGLKLWYDLFLINKKYK